MTDNSLKSVVFDRLTSRAVPIVFTKADGSRREMNATLNRVMIEGNGGALTDEQLAPTEGYQRVFDLGVKGWRMFAWDRLVSADGATVGA